jgi:hypothetical protein
MAAPSIALTVIAGGSGGPAPHHVAVRISDASTPGSGSFETCSFEWRARVDGATPATRISCTEPVNGATETRYLDADQHGANAAYLCQDTGSLTLECRCTNKDGDSSGWVSTSAITVSARNASLYAYADGAAAGDGTGSSWANACTTFQAGVAAAIAKGAGATLFVRGCECTASSAAMSVANVRVTKDPSAGTVTVTLTSNVDAIGCGTNTNGVVIDNLTFTTSSAGNGRIVNCSSAQTSTSICLYNVHHGALDDVVSTQSASTTKGITFINVTEDSQIDSGFITGDCEGFLAWGVSMPLGSTGEHTFRFTNDSAANYYHSFHYCDIGNATTKGAIRWYGYKHLWVHGCKLHRCAMVGRLSPGDADFGGSIFCFERCWFLQIAAQTTEQQLDIGSGFTNGCVRNCFFDDMDIRFYENADITAGTVNDMTIVHNSFKNQREYGVIIYASGLTTSPINQVIRGNVFDGPPLSTEPWIYVKNVSTITGWDFDGNVFERTDGQRVLTDQSGPTTYNFTNYSALSFVGTELQLAPGDLSVNGTTMEPTGTGVATAAPADAPMPHYSYNGYRYSAAAATRAAGAWMDPEDAEDARIEGGRRSFSFFAGNRRVTLTVPN